MERLRKAFACPPRQRRRAEDGNAGLAEEVIERPHSQGRHHRRVGNHEINGMDGQFCQQLVGLVDPDVQPKGRLHREGRFQEPVGGQFRQRIGDAHPKPPRRRLRLSLDGLEQLSAQRKDLVRVPENRLALDRERQVSTAALKKPLTERTLERPHLRADRRLGDMERVGRLRHAAFLGNGPEVEKVVVVQPFHGAGRALPGWRVKRPEPPAPPGRC